MADYKDPQFWQESERAFFDEVGPTALEIFFSGGDGALGQLPPDARLLIDWDVYNKQAVDWLRQWKDVVFSGIEQTTRDGVTNAIDEWVQSGEALPMLEARLARWFDPKRARSIAVTEVTRTYAEGNIAAWKNTGVVSGKVWQTARDELVCPICGPLHNTEASIDGGFVNASSGIGFKSPPAHPNCRCWVKPVVSEDMLRQQIAGDDIGSISGENKPVITTPDGIPIQQEPGGRAPAGGMIGMNGLYYPGGSFLPSTGMGKFDKGARGVRSNKLRKRPVERGKWETQPTPTAFSIYDSIVGTVASEEGGVLSKNLQYLDYAYGGEQNPEILTNGAILGKLDDLISVFHSGVRWVEPIRIQYINGKLVVP